MLNMTVGEIARATGAELVQGDAGRMCHGVARDSRAAGDGAVFVAFPGERVDGNDFAASAARAGAGCVVLTREAGSDLLEECAELGCPVLRAADGDPEAFMLALAAEWRARNPQWVVVGVTGSVGKTTTKDMLSCAIARRWRVHANTGNLNNLIGMPLTLLMAPDDAQVLVLEMGMNHKGEIDRLTRSARPNLAVVTNVGTSHIGFLGSRENIARAKAEIVAGMCAGTLPDGTVVGPCLALTSADDFTGFIADDFATPAGVEVELVGMRATDAVRASDVTLDEVGVAHFTLSFADGWSAPVAPSVPGRHVVSDYLLAVAVADRLGVPREDVTDALANMPATHMRLEVVGGDGHPRIIDDSYNAAPSSMAAALDVLCSMTCAGRRVAVLGEMGELGDREETLHAIVGAYAAAKPIDLLVLVGGRLAGAMREAAVSCGMSDDRIECFETVEEAVRVLAPVLDERDLVLAKASRSAGLDRFVQGVLGQ